MTEARSGPRYGTPDFAYIGRLAATPPADDGPVFMVNLMKYRAVADYPGGEAGALSGREADDLYAPTAILHEIGARIVFAGDVERQLLGQPTWDRVAVVRYPSRRAFLDMQRRSDFQEKHVHKDAGMEQSIVMACLPFPLPAFPAPTPAGPATGDAPFVMVHVLRFAEGGEAAMARYEAVAGALGFPLGVRPEAAFRVEGTVVGDGRAWDQVRFNRFPSHAAFTQLTTHPDHLAAQAVRAGALASTFAVMVAPRLDLLAEAVKP